MPSSTPFESLMRSFGLNPSNALYTWCCVFGDIIHLSLTFLPSLPFTSGGTAEPSNSHGTQGAADLEVQLGM